MGKLLVVIPDDPDTNEAYYSQIAETFYRESYDILIVGKPGEDNYKKRSLDSREERIEDVVSLLATCDSLYHEDFYLMGIGQGAYLLPALNERLDPTGMIMINAGVLSPLAELEYLLEDDSITPGNQNLFSIYGLDDKQMLELKLDNIRDEPFGTLQLAPSSNRNWLSYYEKPLMNQLSKIGGEVLWINHTSYPLISVSGFELADKILAPYNNIEYSKSTRKTDDREFESRVKYMISRR